MLITLAYLYTQTDRKVHILSKYIYFGCTFCLITVNFPITLHYAIFHSANNLIPVFSSSYAGCFCLVCWFSCSFVSEACACFGEWLREVLHVETFVRVLRSSRVNLKINANNTNVFRCVLIESLLFYFCHSFQAVLQK